MVSTERWDGALVHPQRKMEGTQSNQYTKWGGLVWEIQGCWTEGKAGEDDWQVGSRSRQQEGLGRRTGDSREVLKNNPT